MPRTCTICARADRAAIDAALIAHEPFRHIAARFGTSTGALQRHKDEHLPATLVKAEAAKETVRGDTLLAQVQALKGKAISLLLKAEAAGDYRTALSGIREARACLELLAEMEGELNRATTVNVIVSPEWARLRATIISALAPFPDARLAVAARLVEAGGGQ